MIKIGSNISKFSIYSCQPKTKEELKFIINDRVNKEGINCNLNDIDTSLITYMSGLFSDLRFNGDISNWDVSNVKTMSYMFSYSIFNRDISKWDVSKITDMSNMFQFSSFKQNISNWKIRPDCNITYMFFECPIKEEYKPKSMR